MCPEGSVCEGDYCCSLTVMAETTSSPQLSSSPTPPSSSSSSTSPERFIVTFTLEGTDFSSTFVQDSSRVSTQYKAALYEALTVRPTQVVSPSDIRAIALSADRAGNTVVNILLASSTNLDALTQKVQRTDMCVRVDLRLFCKSGTNRLAPSTTTIAPSGGDSPSTDTNSSSAFGGIMIGVLVVAVSFVVLFVAIVVVKRRSQAASTSGPSGSLTTESQSGMSDSALKTMLATYNIQESGREIDHDDFSDEDPHILVRQSQVSAKNLTLQSGSLYSRGAPALFDEAESDTQEEGEGGAEILYDVADEPAAGDGAYYGEAHEEGHTSYDLADSTEVLSTSGSDETEIYHE